MLSVIFLRTVEELAFVRKNIGPHGHNLIAKYNNNNNDLSRRNLTASAGDYTYCVPSSLHTPCTIVFFFNENSNRVLTLQFSVFLPSPDQRDLEGKYIFARTGGIHEIRRQQ